MKELLERWAKLRRERCRPEGDVLSKGQWWVVVPVEGTAYAEAHIQAAGQEAIFEHKLRWEGGTGLTTGQAKP